MWKEGARDCQLSGRAAEAPASLGPRLLRAQVAAWEGSLWEVRAHPQGSGCVHLGEIRPARLLARMFPVSQEKQGFSTPFLRSVTRDCRSLSLGPPDTHSVGDGLPVFGSGAPLSRPLLCHDFLPSLHVPESHVSSHSPTAMPGNGSRPSRGGVLKASPRRKRDPTRMRHALSTTVAILGIIQFPKELTLLCVFSCACVCLPVCLSVCLHVCTCRGMAAWWKWTSQFDHEDEAEGPSTVVRRGWASLRVALPVGERNEEKDHQEQV